MGTCTSANSRIVPDRPTKTVFKLDYDALQTLNSQSAFNEHQLAKARECGCFHCGSRFPPSWITDWMSELLGERTGLCPFCGRDTLVLGTTSHPLSTALLSLLLGRTQEATPRNSDCARLPRSNLRGGRSHLSDMPSPLGIS